MVPRVRGHSDPLESLGFPLCRRAHHLSGAAETSGTFDYFTESINHKAGDTRSDYFGTEEDQLLAEQTGRNPYGLTYFGYAFFVNNPTLVQPVAIDPRRELVDAPRAVLDAVNARRARATKQPLRNGAGRCQGVLPTLDTIQSFQYQPLSRPLFVYTNAQSATRPAVQSFMTFYLSEEILGDPDFMHDVGYLNIPASLRESARRCWQRQVVGTAFGGEISGMSGREISERYSQHCGLR